MGYSDILHAGDDGDDDDINTPGNRELWTPWGGGGGSKGPA